MVNLEIYLCYNENGDFIVDDNAEDAQTTFNLENHEGPSRMILLNVSAPEPVAEVKVVIPEKIECEVVVTATQV
jgi:hypothetical protein